MTHKVYLRAIANALRDEILPLMESPQGRLTLLACERQLLRLTQAQFATAPPEPLPIDDLPTPLRQQLQTAAPRCLAAHEIPSENSALDASNAAHLDVAARWIDGADIVRDANAIATMVDWEGRLQDAAESEYQRLETPLGAAGTKGAAPIDPDAVQSYFQQRYGNRVRLLEFRRLVGGTSKQTAMAKFSGLTDLPADIVIRRDQTTATLTGSVVHEYPLLQILHASGVAVPRPFFLEASTQPLGKAFIAMQRLHGSSLASHFAVPPDPQLAFRLAEQMARVHAIPLQAVANLFGGAAPGDAIARRREQLEKMRTDWRHFSQTPSVTLSAAFRWLENNLDCAEGPMTLVHGDLAFHNILFDGSELVALLDWETAHIDHPAGDLGYVRPVVEQMVPWQDFFNCYVAAGGQPMSQRQIHFFGIWEILRINILLRHARMLYETGATNDVMLGQVGSYYVPRFVQRISQHLRRALHEVRE